MFHVKPLRGTGMTDLLSAVSTEMHRQRRAMNDERREEVHNAIRDALIECGNLTPHGAIAILTAIVDEQVPHVAINY